MTDESQIDRIARRAAAERFLADDYDRLVAKYGEKTVVDAFWGGVEGITENKERRVRPSFIDKLRLLYDTVRYG